ncbi:MAG: Asp-tRNA(Asn)/Glu-tRNA(Gln) amidotransferase subunit GatB [Christensenellales bacterium]|jgi:aspartyl-tRNA(Asn)/glutamyl-tRNA(Gln) amidotransferase subunit B
MDYEIVIGLEVHAELDTDSKIYCGCTTRFGGEENTHCCPVCVGMPGMMPALNKKVVEYCIKAGLAIGCSISKNSRQDRKHYYYPDLPKNFQTSQYDQPICLGGAVEIDTENGKKTIGITRIHIEEDAGKLIHESYGTRIDYNRGGVPLIEIVSEPDIRSAEEAKAFLETLRSILLYTGVSNCRMEEGSLRCDVNLSIRERGAKEFGTRTEMKNLNSFRAVTRAIEYEAQRQIDVIESGGEIMQQTLRWDDVQGINYAMRSKEDAHDYLYFPEPDIMPIVIDEKWLESIRSEIPELPASRKERYVSQHGFSERDAGVVTASKALSDLLDGAVEMGTQPKDALNYIISDISRVINEKGIEPEDVPINAEQLSSLIDMVGKGTISRTIASKVMELMFESKGVMPEEIVKEKQLAQISDEDEIRAMCIKAVSESEKAVADYKAGKEKALKSIVGRVMKASAGKANPAIVNEIIKELLS